MPQRRAPYRRSAPRRAPAGIPLMHPSSDVEPPQTLTAQSFPQTAQAISAMLSDQLAQVLDSQSVQILFIRPGGDACGMERCKID